MSGEQLCRLLIAISGNSGISGTSGYYVEARRTANSENLHRNPKEE
jgi:hypothetical protein